MLDSDMKVGQIFEDRYRILEEIGRGSYGVVYRVEDVQSQELFALKLLLPWAEHDEMTRKRFEREAEFSQLLVHPAIVQVKYFGHTPEGNPYLLMELVEGRSLDRVLKREHSLSIERTKNIARQVLEALDIAHSQGIVHRDLKPENLVLCQGDSSQEERVKIFDFGIAKQVNEESDLASIGRLTMTGTTLGTVDYMSPEQVEGDDLSPASDFYSLGVVLYEMVTGERPYHSKDSVQIMIMHVSAPVPVLPQAIATTPLGRAITKSLQKDPKDRPASSQEFLDLLEKTEEKAPPPAKSGTPSAASSSSMVVQSPRSKVQRNLSRYWLPVVILILLVILVLSQL